jgi:hypothetical protein
MTQTTYQLARLRVVSGAGQHKEMRSAIESELVDDEDMMTLARRQIVWSTSSELSAGQGKQGARTHAV